MSTLAKKLKYLRETKQLIKEKIQEGIQMPDDTPFRKYPDYIGSVGFKMIQHNTETYLRTPPGRFKVQHDVDILPIRETSITKQEV